MDQSGKVEIERNEVEINIPSQWHSERGVMIMDRDVRTIKFDVREMTMFDRMKLAKVLSTIG